jgi:hypothetical protein
MQVGAFRAHGKMWLLIAGLVFVALQTAFADNHVDLGEGLAVGTVGANAVLTYAVPQFPGYRWTKNLINAVLSLLALGAMFWGGLADGLSGSELTKIIVTAGVGAGVFLVNAVSDNGSASGVGLPTTVGRK